nr:glyoxalase superfamily protein [uncultured Pseudomonas sp.]
MISIEQAKQMAKRLRASLQVNDQQASHSMALELVAHQLGYKDWNTAAALLPTETAQPAQPAISFSKAIPILRMFDETKAREFYLDFLGFSVEFEHRFEADLPLYLGIARDGLQLHLSEHHGDASPGSTTFVPMHNIELLRDELQAKRYGYGRPDIVEQGWGKVLEVYDPFGNRIRFCQD